MGPLGWLRSSPRRAWLTTFLLVSTIGAAWAVSQPSFAAIDEPNHSIKALSVARGQWMGNPVPADLAPDNPVFNKGWAYFDVPGIYEDAVSSASCYRGLTAVPASCLDVGGPAEDTPVMEPDSRYPPAYYLAVGVVERVAPSGLAGFTAMRLMTTLIAAALIASATVSLLRLPGAPVALLGLAVATTPMAFHMAGSVNPSGPEIAAGIALWSSGIVLAREAARRVDPRLVLRVVAAAAVLSLSRPLSPLFAAVIGAFVVALCTRSGLGRLVRDRAAQVGAGTIAAVALFQLGWVAIVKPNYFGEGVGDVSNTEILRNILGKAPEQFRQMVGVFGSPDMYAPDPAVFLWALALGGLAFAALAVGRRRATALAGVVLVATIAIPMVADYAQARDLSYPWQARYTLPIALGIPLLLGAAVATGRHVELLGARLARVGFAVTVGLAQALCFLAVLRRYTVSNDGGLTFWGADAWAPVVPVALLAPIALIALVAWVTWLTGPVPAAAGRPGTATPGPGAAADEVAVDPAPQGLVTTG